MLCQYINFHKVRKFEALSNDLQFSSFWPPPARSFEPSKVHFTVKFATFSRICAFSRFSSLPRHLKPRPLTESSILTLFQKLHVGRKRFIWPNSWLWKRESRKTWKIAISREICNVPWKVDFEGWRVLPGGDWRLDKRKKWCHLSESPISVLFQKMTYWVKVLHLSSAL